jgi:hypothetical protein
LAAADRPPPPQAPMSRPLLRGCLDCRTAVRGKARCIDCQRQHDQTKAAKRPRFEAYSEQQRRARTVAEWRSLIVRCVPCNSARSALALRSLTTLLGQDPSLPEHAIAHLDGDDPGPVAA